MAKIVEHFTNLCSKQQTQQLTLSPMDRFLVYCRVLPPGSTDKFNLRPVPENSVTTGLRGTGQIGLTYAVQMGSNWPIWFPHDLCPHCNHTPCCANAKYREWYLAIKGVRGRIRYCHPGHARWHSLVRDEDYVKTWMEAHYREFVLNNIGSNMTSEDRVEYRCVCIEEEIAVTHPKRCCSCGFQPCLVHQAGKMIYECLRRERKSRSNIGKFREMMKSQWLLRKELRDRLYFQSQDLCHNEDSPAKKYRPSWMDDNLFSNGQGPECVEAHGHLLWDHHYFDDDSSSGRDDCPISGEDEEIEERIAFHRWVEWCEGTGEKVEPLCDENGRPVEKPQMLLGATGGKNTGLL